jgi:hypothetical protein
MYTFGEKVTNDDLMTTRGATWINFCFDKIHLTKVAFTRFERRQ